MSDYYQGTGSGQPPVGGGQTADTGGQTDDASQPPTDTGSALPADDTTAPAGSAPIEDGAMPEGSPAPKIGKSAFEEAGVGTGMGPEPEGPKPAEPEPSAPEPTPPPPATPTDETPSGGAGTGQTPIDAAKAASHPPAGGPQEAYNAFIDQLLIQLGFDKLEEPQKGQLVDAIKQRVEARVLRTLMTSLTEEQTKELNTEIEGKGLSEEAIINLLVEKAPNASTAILSALDDLYMEMKEETDMLWKAAGAKAAADSDAQGDQNQ